MPRLISDRLVIATHNSGKLREMRELLAPYGIETISAGDFGLDEPEETGSTFAENAALKAETACSASGFPAFADDSGLCVAALDGAPGIHSARYATRAGGFAQAMADLEAEVTRGGRDADARAWFVSALALARPGEATIGVEGRIDGTLVFPPRGTLGFGYDPIFRPDGHDRTFGEMSSEEKHGLPNDGSQALSHRARAFQAFARLVLSD